MSNEIPSLARPDTGQAYILSPASRVSPGQKTDFASLVTKAVELARTQENLALAACDEVDGDSTSGTDQLSSLLDLYNLARPGLLGGAAGTAIYPSAMERLLGSRGQSVAPASGPSPGLDSEPMPYSQSILNPLESASPVNKNRFVEWMDSHALTQSAHHCAMFVRKGLEAAGMSTGDRPADAGDYGPFLLRHGARVMPQDDSYLPQPGDTAVFEKNDQHPYGHIEVFDGEHWISDFRQRGFSPYRDAASTPPVTIYRIS